MSKLFVCGRVHKQQPLKRKDQDRAKAIVAAVRKIMQDELSHAACERWYSRLNAELGRAAFESGDMPVAAAKPASAPRVWVPAKPLLTTALLDELAADLQDAPHEASVGSEGAISKVLARRVVESLCATKGRPWLETCGELSAATLDSQAKLTQTLSRVVFDLFVYVHARAAELQRREGKSGVVLELHSSDQSLIGRETRGCGVVCCQSGREVFARAIMLVRDALGQKARPPAEDPSE